jgi:crotonobetainyl-CoA:carnitine CoA-transferase CaiB-like acyl-CoA transferase
VTEERDFISDYASSLLSDLNVRNAVPLQTVSEHPAVTWARSGAMALTGHRDGAALICPAPLSACAEGALAALRSLAADPAALAIEGASLLGERAAITGHGRNGSISPGGSCRFLETSDGWIALNLAREDDWRMMPALMEQDTAADWSAVAAAARGRQADDLVARGRDLGLAIAHPFSDRAAGPWHTVQHETEPAAAPKRRPRVVELASLWAGPLCGHLLALMGAEVIKVESVARPDGARFGPPAFFDLLNAGKRSVALDFASAEGRDRLLALLRGADIVIEASRPRGLAQLGISAEALVRAAPGRVWLSITGYGRTGEAAGWVAFGDDAGVAAGLSALLPTDDAPVFCGDAIADPLTGLHGALAAYARWSDGRGGLVSVALRDVVAHCIAYDGPTSADGWHERARAWQSLLDARNLHAAPPVARPVLQPARPLGADTASVLNALGVVC